MNENNDEIRAGIVPKQTKSEIKLMKGFDAQRFFGLLFTMMIGYLFGIIIGGWWKYLFVLFAVGVFFIATTKSPTDPHKKFYQGLLDFLRFSAAQKTLYGTRNDNYIAYSTAKAIAKKEKEEKDEKRKAKKAKKAKEN
ncbi:MAG: hypothetical protein IJ571_00545 [Ruminococcus sp.]|nr:hypothetical protein [Ruminococcus sp.]